LLLRQLKVRWGFQLVKEFRFTDCGFNFRKKSFFLLTSRIGMFGVARLASLAGFGVMPVHAICPSEHVLGKLLPLALRRVVRPADAARRRRDVPVQRVDACPVGAFERGSAVLGLVADVRNPSALRNVQPEELRNAPDRSRRRVAVIARLALPWDAGIPVGDMPKRCAVRAIKFRANQRGNEQDNHLQEGSRIDHPSAVFSAIRVLVEVLLCFCLNLRQPILSDPQGWCRLFDVVLRSSFSSVGVVQPESICRGSDSVLDRRHSVVRATGWRRFLLPVRLL
jgi:hypothetical protein